MTQKFQGASGQSNKILPITRTSSSSFPWAVKNSQAQSHAQAQAEDTGASTGTPVIIYDESRLTAAGVRSAHKVIIYDESRSGAAGPGELQGNKI